MKTSMMKLRKNSQENKELMISTFRRTRINSQRSRNKTRNRTDKTLRMDIMDRMGIKMDCQMGIKLKILDKIKSRWIKIRLETRLRRTKIRNLQIEEYFIIIQILYMSLLYSFMAFQLLNNIFACIFQCWERENF